MFTLLNSHFFLIIASAIMIIGYVPINKLLRKGFEFKNPVDDRIVLIPWYVFPYLLFYIPWLFLFYSSLFFQPLHTVQQVAFATFLSCLIGYFCFIFFPTYVITEFPHGHGLAFKLLQYVQRNDRKFNAFPSMHVYMVTILTMFSSVLYPQFMVIFVLMGTAVSVSTVFTKRHYVYDIFGGLFVGVVCTLLSLYFI